MPERIWDVGFDCSMRAAKDTASANTSLLTWNFTVRLSWDYLNLGTKFKPDLYKAQLLKLWAYISLTLKPLIVLLTLVDNVDNWLETKYFT
jgi:hypothetical protein